MDKNFAFEPDLICYACDMPFAPDNERWVRDEIRTALDKALKDIKPPSGFRKALHVLREYGILAVNFTIIVSLVIFAATQWSASNRRLADDAVSHTRTDDRLKMVEEHMTGLRALIASSQPTRKQNQDAAKELLAEARLKSIPAIPETVVSQAGTSFIEATPSEPKAWEVAVDFVNYRSTLSRWYRSVYEDLRRKNYPWCFANLPADAGVSISPDGHTATLHGPVVYESCVMQIDDEHAAAASAVTPGGEISNGA